MKNNMEIGNRIREIRENLNLNRDKFSELVDISESFLTKIELGNKSLSIETLMKISQGTGVSADYLLFGNLENNNMQKKISKLLYSTSEKHLELIYTIIKNICIFNKAEKENKTNK